MARVGKIKYEFQNEHLQSPISCNSSGEFSCRLPIGISTALMLPYELKGKTMEDVTNAFFDALNRYKNAKTKQEILIHIQYQASGNYNWSLAKNSVLFDGNSDYHMRMAFSEMDALAFKFNVVIKETVDGTETLYRAVKGKNMAHGEHMDEPEKYFKYGNYYPGNENGKYIPYSDKALDSLELVQERIRSASEVLFNFIEQPAQAITEQLNSGMKAIM